MPGITGQVSRPSTIHVSAFDLNGNEIDMTATGLLARAIQHESDHLNGVLFIDRVSESEMKQIELELEEFALEFSANRNSGQIPADDTIKKRLLDLENEYC